MRKVGGDGKRRWGKEVGGGGRKDAVGEARGGKGASRKEVGGGERQGRNKGTQEKDGRRKEETGKQEGGGGNETCRRASVHNLVNPQSYGHGCAPAAVPKAK